MAYIIIQCGSSARGDSGPNSDIDMICIWDSKPNFKELSNIYKELTFYSRETILRMRSKGSLFLTHLDLEGKYLEGNRDLIKLFKDFKPQTKYLLENLQTTKQFIKDIKWHPNSKEGNLWLLDVLYVSLRNYLYCKNAINKVYTFSFIDLISSANLTPNEINCMLAIREGKYNYRSKINSPTIFPETTTLEATCAKIVTSPIQFNQGGRTNWEKDWPLDYWSERLIERAIINGEHSDKKFMQKLQNHNYHKFELKDHLFSIISSHKN